MRPVIALALGALLLTGCTAGSEDPFVGFGAEPSIPAPEGDLLPRVNPAKAVGWPEGAAPVAPEGFVVTRFAGDLSHPRWLLVLPNGDVLVSEASSEPKPPEGLMDRIAQRVQAYAGALKPSPNRIMLLRDANGDGLAEVREVFASGLNRPQGMALVGGTLYIANTDALVATPYRDGQLRMEGIPEKVVDLPAGPINHHWVKNVIASPDGQRLYVTSGSNSNIAENGLAAEENRAAILEVDPAAKTLRLYASGLRNPNGMAYEPVTGALWTAVNERDMLGDDLVPDYMTRVQEGGFYGWPYSYFGDTVDARVEPQRPDLVAEAIRPDYALGPHTASLGLTFYTAQAFPERYQGGVFVGQHGSWNRQPLSGYRVVFVPFTGGMPQGEPEAFLTGFLNDRDQAMGRPVDVAVDRRGALLVTDDAGGAVWRVAPAPQAAQTAQAAER
ncbi:PQQ-dependent sugar dehydrogenase [Phenylobacterium sp.]|uniref:PQQ-dependent sugar dehydrogenase n=1 Tax=Phenylobacterium sp. TaxID=1871053 RepID=UPI0040360909